MSKGFCATLKVMGVISAVVIEIYTIYLLGHDALGSEWIPDACGRSAYQGPVNHPFPGPFFLLRSLHLNGVNDVFGLPVARRGPSLKVGERGRVDIGVQQFLAGLLPGLFQAVAAFLRFGHRKPPFGRFTHSMPGDRPGYVAFCENQAALTPLKQRNCLQKALNGDLNIDFCNF
jgi:hypothetical protein